MKYSEKIADELLEAILTDINRLDEAILAALHDEEDLQNNIHNLIDEL